MIKITFEKDLKKWLNNDPYRAALLVTETPVSSTTLNRIRSGSYIPSKRMVHAMEAVMRSNPVNDKEKGKK